MELQLSLREMQVPALGWGVEDLGLCPVCSDSALEEEVQVNTRHMILALQAQCLDADLGEEQEFFFQNLPRNFQIYLRNLGL